MTTSPLPTPTLQPLGDDKNLLTIVESAGSCCAADGCCSL